MSDSTEIRILFHEFNPFEQLHFCDFSWNDFKAYLSFFESPKNGIIFRNVFFCYSVLNAQ